MVIDVLGQPVGPIFKGLDRLIAEDGTDRLSRTIGTRPTDLCRAESRCEYVHSVIADVSETQMTRW